MKAKEEVSEINEGGKNRKNRKVRGFLIAIIAVLLTAAILASVWNAYVSDYYHAWDEATRVEANHTSGITVTENEDGYITFAPEEARAGIIFYPGAKVEYTAYCPLMSELAQLGYLCVLVKMPQNMAILDINAADGIQDLHPEITDWYMAGHSMGGAMAAAYLKKNAADYKGLILLAAYSATDLSDDQDLAVLSIYGSEDGVLGREKYESSKKNLPADFTEYVIEGGCHAYFGMYGAQKGDGVPTISNTEQIESTADRIDLWIGENAAVGK